MAPHAYSADFESSSSDGSGSEPPRAWSPSKKLIATCVVGFALCCLVAYGAASQQTKSSFRSGHVDQVVKLAASEPSYYWVKSTPKEGMAEKWWKRNAEVSASEDLMKKAGDEDHSFGFHMLYFFPTSKDGAIYSVFELKAGKTKQDLLDYAKEDTICGNLFSMTDNTVTPIDSSMSFIPVSHWKSGKPVDKNANSKGIGNMTAFLAHHTFKPDVDKTAWAELLGKYTTPDTPENDKYLDLMKAAKLDPVHSDVFISFGADGPMWCLWVSSSPITGDALKAWLDETVVSNQLINTVYPIPSSLTGGFIGPY